MENRKDKMRFGDSISPVTITVPEGCSGKVIIIGLEAEIKEVIPSERELEEK